MNLWFRVLKVLLIAFFRPRLALTAESRLTFRVWPTDLDFNVHMNNARYMAVMDLGRLDLIRRTAMGRMILRDKLQPVIGGSLVRFRRALGPFQRFELRTRVLGWDAKWIFIEHRIERNGELSCHAVVKSLFVGPKGSIPSDTIVAFLGHEGEPPEVAPWIADWLLVEAARDQPVPVNQTTMNDTAVKRAG